MVAPENNHRVVGLLQPIEFIEQAPHLRVHVTDAGIVSANRFTRLTRSERPRRIEIDVVVDSIISFAE